MAKRKMLTEETYASGNMITAEGVIDMLNLNPEGATTEIDLIQRTVFDDDSDHLTIKIRVDKN